MKIKNSALIRGLGVTASGVVNRWMATLDYRCAYYDPCVDPAYANDGRVRLYLFWHEYMQFFIYLRRHCGLAMMLSRHSDADLLEQIAHLTGFETVRGSTKRGGAFALHEMVTLGKARIQLTMTPDGPRGPRRQMAPGAIYLASRLGIPIVAMGVAYDRPLRMPTWDRFAIPRPFSRGRIIASGDIEIPPNLSRTGIEHYRRYVESLLTRLGDDAEDWAVRGYSVRGESSMMPGPRRSILYHALPKQIETNGRF